MSKFIGLNDLYTLQEWVTLQTQRAGLSVSFEPGGTIPRTSKNQMIIPAFNPSMTEDDVINLRSHVIHECAHHTHGKDIFANNKPWSDITPETSEELFSLFNMIEDSRINRKQARQFKGDAIHLSAGDRLATERLCSSLEKSLSEHGLTPDTMPEYAKKHLPCLNIAVDSQNDWNIGLQVGARGLIDTVRVGKETSELYAKLKALGFPERIAELRSVEESFECAKDMFEAAGFGDADEEIKKAKAQSIEGQGSEKGDGKEGRGKSEGANKNKKGSVGKDEDEFKLGKPSDYLWTNHKQESFGWGSGSGAPMSYVSSPNTNTAWGPQDPRLVELINYTPHKLGMLRESKGIISPRWRVTWNVGKISNAVANKIRRILQIRSQTEYHAGYKTGSLHKKQIYRVAMPVVGDGEANKKIFRRKEEKDILDCAVSLVVDASGSMDGLKYVHACMSAVLMCEVFAKALRVPCEISTFTTGGTYGQNVFGLIKDFGGKATPLEMKDRFGSFAQFMSGNGDPDALLFAYRRLLTRGEKRKICIIFSDGSPSYAESGDPGRGIRKIVEEMEQNGIEVFGVGLMTDDVERYYKHNIVIDSAEELESNVLKLLAKIVTS